MNLFSKTLMEFKIKNFQYYETNSHMKTISERWPSGLELFILKNEWEFRIKNFQYDESFFRKH
jgi:hypothetical protein